MKRLQALMKDLEEAIQAITDEMDEAVASCPFLSRQRKLLMSLDGTGRVVATNMAITTEAFTRFEDQSKVNCYAGNGSFLLFFRKCPAPEDKSVAPGRQRDEKTVTLGSRSCDTSNRWSAEEVL